MSEGVLLLVALGIGPGIVAAIVAVAMGHADAAINAFWVVNGAWWLLIAAWFHRQNTAERNEKERQRREEEEIEARRRRALESPLATAAFAAVDEERDRLRAVLFDEAQERASRTLESTIGIRTNPQTWTMSNPGFDPIHGQRPTVTVDAEGNRFTFSSGRLTVNHPCIVCGKPVGIAFASKADLGRQLQGDVRHENCSRW